ncbi:hypothetical protein [Mycobacterium sp. ZZG]
MAADRPRASAASPFGGSDTAAARAAALTEATRDDPAGRLRLLERTYRGPYDEAGRHLPFRRAAVSFMAWQLRRGVLNPLTDRQPGSPWWRAVNERLLRDQCEAVAGAGGAGGAPSSPTIAPWTDFVQSPTGRNWYRAHNKSIVAAYVDHEASARQENEAERFFLNVTLVRVLFAHALAAAPKMALGPLSSVARVLGDPRLGAVGLFMSLSKVVPTVYPADREVKVYLADENRLSRLLDYGVIVPRLQRLYAWSASELEQPELLRFIRDGAPVYAWPYESRWVWQPATPTLPTRLVRAATVPR